MKILITGYKGQMGTDLVNEIKAKHPEDEIVGMDIDECDITDGPAVMAFITKEKPDAIIHLAAYTSVDRAETESLKCTDVNAIGTANVVLAASAVDAKLLYISTDYVFDGKKDGPYEPNDPKSPISVYGMTKAAGEDAVLKLKKYFIVRTSWVFGKNGHNFIYTMLRMAQSNAPVQVVCDVLGSPTYTVHLVRLLDDMIHTEKYGIYHATNEGYTTWCKYAQMIFTMVGYPEDKARPIPSVRYHAAAKRPQNSRLDKKCLDDAGFQRLPRFEDALKEFLIDTGYYGNLKGKDLK
jgi:dTDP-4-dehydrorhamnose reductase